MFRDNLQTITPYIPGKSIESIKQAYGLTNVLKLASNENPWGSAADYRKLSTPIEQYPDYTTHPIMASLARHYGVTTNQLILGNGSDELLQIIALAIINPGDEILSSTCTFSEYKFVAQLTGATYIEVPMTNHTYNINALINAITEKTKIIFIANPNNPTGTIVTHAQIKQLLSAASQNTLIVIDEAYAEYVTNSNYPKSLELIQAHPNIMITRTFSKIYGLASLRIGYGIAPPDIINGLLSVRQPFNVNGLALDCAESALKNTSFVEKSIDNNNKGKTYITQALACIKCTVVPSEGNFLYIDFDPLDGNKICEALLRRGIIVRSMKSFGQPNAIRVTIGSLEQNQRFIEELNKCLKQL
jgi:histidinol-phosphate aminotransferase